MLMRTEPFRQLDRLADQLIGAPVAVAPMDAYRRGDRVVVQIDLPGVDPSSVDLTVEQNVLTVTAERQWEPTDDQQVLVAERPHGTFRRQLLLGDGVDDERVEASFDDGVLTVVIPVAEQAMRRKVEISARGGSAKQIETGSSAA